MSREEAVALLVAPYEAIVSSAVSLVYVRVKQWKEATLARIDAHSYTQEERMCSVQLVLCLLSSRGVLCRRRCLLECHEYPVAESP